MLEVDQFCMEPELGDMVR